MWTKKLTALLAIGVFLLINACTVNNPISNNNRDAIDEALSESLQTNHSLAAPNKKKTNMSAAVQELLTPQLRIDIPNAKGPVEKEQKFDIAVNNVPAKDFFMGLVKDTKYNMTINPEITGNISLELKSVTVPQTMEAIRDTYGFEYEKTSYGYKVFPRALETRVFKIDYIDIDRVGQSHTSVGSGQITNTVQNTLTSTGVNTSQESNSNPSGVIDTTSNSKFWEILKQNLETLIGTQNGHSVATNPKSGTIMVKAYPNELRAVAKYLDTVQNIIHRQVIIEAKILEVRLNAEFKTGINWKALGLQQMGYDAKDLISGTITDLSKTNAGVFQARASDGGAFSSTINLLNNQGNVNVLSSPRIATINNQKAVIKVGDDRFFVTNVSSDTNNGSGTSSTTTSDITLTPFFSGISLDVTPQIDDEDNITIHIHPIISKVTQDNRIFEVNGQPQNLPLAKSVVTESDSVVRAQSGQVVVIGGLMKSEGADYNAGTPGAEKLPGIGGLFKNTSKESSKYELVILLRPIIAESTKTWQKELKAAADSIKNMNSGFSYDVVPTKPKR